MEQKYDGQPQELSCHNERLKATVSSSNEWTTDATHASLSRPNQGYCYAVGKASYLLLRIKCRVPRNGKAEDCILVLHDADEQTHAPKDDHRTIQKICNRYKAQVFYLVAQNTIEAWLLADEGVCKWLGIQAKNADTERDPKHLLARHLKNKNQRFKYPRHLDTILRHIDGSGAKHSPSLKRGVKYICR